MHSNNINLSITDHINQNRESKPLLAETTLYIYYTCPIMKVLSNKFIYLYIKANMNYGKRSRRRYAYPTWLGLCVLRRQFFQAITVYI